MKKSLIAVLLMSCTVAGVSSSAVAATDDAKAAYSAEKDRADNEYKGAKEKCNSLAGNAKDVCIEQAKFDRTSIKANAKAKYENTDKARTNAQLDIADAQYSVSKQKCKDSAGNDKDVCIKQAKDTRDTAKAQAKAGKQVAAANNDVAQTKNDGDYNVAIEKCGRLAGSAKDSCVASAKSQYGK